MGIPLGGTTDLAIKALSGSLSATGRMASPYIEFASPYIGALGTRWNLSLGGAFVGTVRLERSFDGGSIWYPCSSQGAVLVFSGDCSEVIEAPERGVIYALNVLSYTSGPITWRASL